MIHLNNRPPGTRTEFQAREIIDAGFLELVRYGIRRADDPLMVDSLKVVDAVHQARTAAGRRAGCATTGMAMASAPTAARSRAGDRAACGRC